MPASSSSGSTLVRRADTTPTEHSAAAPWSESVEAPAGARLLYVSGQVPPVVDARAPIEERAAYGDMETQTRGVLKRLADKLANAGYAMGDLVKLQCFLVGEARFGGRPDLEGFGRAWREVFAAEDLPARTRIEVVRLMNPAWLVEIEAVAAKLP
jgi:enamine deaminase RidA (YjgF/YER057c/UK114 family)